MSYAIAIPDFMTAAAADLATIGSTLDEAHRAAAPATLAVVPAAADEVSVSIARLFSEHGQAYQAVARDEAMFQEHFVQNLTAGAASYASIEDAIARLLGGLAFDLSVSPGAAALPDLADLLANIVDFVLGLPFLLIFAPFILIGVAIAEVQAIIEAITGIIAG
jgi:hypothetical protein